MEKLLVLHLVAGFLSAVFILLQDKGTGLQGALGGAGTEIYTTKRGVEKLLSNLTILAVSLYVGTAIIMLISS